MCGGEQYVNKMPKPKKRKSTKERLKPFRQQVARIKQYLSNRGISARIGEIEDYMSPDLHYDENKAVVLETFGMRMGHRYTNLEAFIAQVQMRDDERSEHAQLIDYRKRAVHTWTPREVLKDLSKADRWFNFPNRYDIVGIDVKTGLKPKRKARRKKKK